jgi:hypothetical protein
VLGIHVDVARDVETEQLVLRVVAEHANEGGIRGHELAVRRRLEDAGRDVLEQLAVALLGRFQREQRMRALGCIPQHLVDQVPRYLVLAQEVECAALEHVVTYVLVLVAHQGHDRNVGGLGLDAQEGRRAAAVGEVQIEQDRVEPAYLELREPVRQAGDDLQPVRPPVDRLQRGTHLSLFARCGADQQYRGGRHLTRV